MRLVKTILMVTLAGLWLTVTSAGIGFAQPAAPAKKKTNERTLPETIQPKIYGPGDVVVQKNGKSYDGWIDNRGKIGVKNAYGRTLYIGNVDRLGGAEVRDETTGEVYQGRVNPMGVGLLFAPNSGDTLKLRVWR